MKKYTTKAAAVVCNALLREAKKESRESLRYSWIDTQGNQCFTDGFRAYRLTVPLLDMPLLPDHFTPVQLDDVFKPFTAGDVVEMPAPDMDSVKSFINDHRYQRKTKRIFDNTPYDLGEHFPMVNARYLLDMLKLFPDAKWYVDADPFARMIRPIFISCQHGTACLMPIRSADKQCKPGAEIDAPIYKYLVYSRPAGEKRFLVADIGNGSVGMNLVYAPRYTDERLEALREALDECAATNPGASFQIRKMDGKTVVYTAVATFTPESFAEMYAA